MDKRRLIDLVDSHYAKVCLYASVTVILTMAVIMLLYSASPVIWTIWNLLCSVLEPLIYGAAICYVMTPLVNWVSGRLEKRPKFADAQNEEKRHNAAIVISLLLVVLAFLLIIAMFAVLITHSLSSLNWTTIREMWESAQGDLTNLIAKISERLESWGLISSGSDPNSGLLGLFNGAKNIATTALFSVIFSVYLLFDGERVASYLNRVLRAILGGRGVDVSRLLADADKVFSGYFRGQGIDALIVGVSSAILLTIVGVPYAPIVGLLTGLGNLVPYLGGPVGFGSIALMCLPEGAWAKMLWGFLAMGLVMFLDGNVINPKLLSNSVEVHPILVLVALIAGGAIGGIAGMLVAVPTAAFLKIQLDRWLEKREAKIAQTLQEETDDHR